MQNVLISILPIFFIIASGYVIRQKFIKKDEFWKSAEALTYYLLFPCLLVLKISSANFEGANIQMPIMVTIFSTLLVVGMAFLLKYLFSLNGSLFTSVFQGSTRYNSYVFIGLSQALFGNEGAAITGVFIAYMIVITNVMSVVVMNIYGESSKKSYSEMALALGKNPLIAFTVVGLLLNYFGIKISSVLGAYMHILGDAASPLSLLSVGAGLSIVMGKERVYATLSSSTLKLVVLPLITIFLLNLFSVS